MPKLKKNRPGNPFSGFRNEWPINPVTRVVPAKKGKGSYDRSKDKRGVWNDSHSPVCFTPVMQRPVSLSRPSMTDRVPKQTI